MCRIAAYPAPGSIRVAVVERTSLIPSAAIIERTREIERATNHERPQEANSKIRASPTIRSLAFVLSALSLTLSRSLSLSLRVPLTRPRTLTFYLRLFLFVDAFEVRISL